MIDSTLRGPLLSPDDGTSAGGAGTGADNNSGVENKTFTQDQVTGMIAKESKKAKESILKELGFTDFNNLKDGLSKFNEWKDSQKSVADKLTEENSIYKKQLEERDSKLKDLETTMNLYSKGVKPEYVKDFSVLLKNSDEQDFEKAFESVSKRFPTMLNSSTDNNDNSGADKNKTGQKNNVKFGVKSQGSQSELDERVARMRARAGLKK